MTSVLQTEYAEPTRPVSNKELEDSRLCLTKFLRLGDVTASHKKCRHWYRVRANGRKEKMINEESNPDSGHCSVCWRIKSTPSKLRANANEISREYKAHWLSNPENPSHYQVELEKVFYRWLYEDNK
jgi:hypothetical protein